MLYKIIGLAIAGAAGTLCRYALAYIVQRSVSSTFPWGTLAVNMLGCFLFGLIWTMTQQRHLINSEARSIIMIGFLGSFTTFSAFLFETDQFLEHSQWFLASVNVAGELVAGLVAYLAGAFLGRLI